MHSLIYAKLLPLRHVNRLWRLLLLGSIRMDRNSKISVGSNLRTGRNVTVVLTGSCQLILGDDVYLGDNTSIRVYNSRVEIGSNCRIANNVVIASSNYSRSKIGALILTTGKSILIGRSCFIGSNVVISGGAVVHDFTDVGAGSYVGNDLLRRGLFLGSPAKWKREN